MPRTIKHPGIRSVCSLSYNLQFLKTYFLVPVLLLAVAGNVRAQLDVTAGLGTGFGFVTGRQGYYNTPTIGIYAAAGYQPPYSRLFPSFSFMRSEVQLPLYSAVASGLNVFARSDNFMLHLNYRTSPEPSYWVYSFGLGVSDITTPNGNVYDGGSTDMQLIDSGSTHLHPAFNGAVRYVRSLSARRPICFSLEAGITYISIYPRVSEYYIEYGTTLTKTKLYGDFLYPHLIAAISYTFSRRN